MLSKMRKNKSGFTLLELLVVVAILAIIGGALISSYDGLEAQAAKSVATNSIASIDAAVRNFVVVEGELPNNGELLAAATPATLSATQDNQGISIVDTITAASEVAAGNLGSKLAGKFTLTALTAEQLTALNNAGITIGRYLHTAGNAGGTNNTLDVIENGAGVVGNATVDDIADITIPAHAFEAPRPGDQNRGRGFPKLLATGDQVMVWNNSDGYNNRKIGAGPNDVLIAFGIGNASTIVSTASSNQSGALGNVGLTSAPFYGDVGKNEYPHYVMLINVGPSGSEFETAKLQTVVDARGDFLDEEFAESTGQKQ